MNSWSLYTGVSAAAGAICLVTALIMWTIGNRMWPAVVLGFTITGVAGIMSSPIGGWLRWGVDRIGSLLGGTVGQWTGIAILTVAAIAILLIVLLNVFGHFNVKGGVGEGGGIEGRTLILGAALPITAGAIPGSVGLVISMILGFVTQIFAWPIAAGLGL